MFDRKSIGKLLKSQAIELGACQQGIDRLEELNEQELINRYIHFIDFVLEHDYPSNELIKANFDRELLHKNNIYVDEYVERRNARAAVVIQGHCTGQLMYDSWTTSDVYVRHDSELIIDCSRFCKVFISVYDNAKVKVIQRDGSTVYVYKHGHNCEVETEGEVMIRESGV